MIHDRENLILETVSSPTKPRRPLSVTLLAGLVLIVAVVYFTRLARAILEWEFLLNLLPISPAYLAVSGLVWSVVFTCLAWGIWRGRAWALRWCWLALFAFSLYYWLDRLFMPGYPGRNTNWPFSLGANLLVLAWSGWVLSRPKARSFFGERYERGSENPRIA
jgi:hypothetical protein